ncbi:MAG: VWA domain-containing protein [Acidobacteria bacterium]|nr:VWA domain-containing protein [Acidobacteriota bacterium]
MAITSPDGSAPIFGEVRVAAEVTAEEAVAATLLVDGVVQPPLTRPPYEWHLDVGQENRPHRFQVLLRGASGGTASASVETPALRVDLEVGVELQQLYVSVEAEGDPVDDLLASDFTVRDGGRPQKLTTFARGDVPFTALLLVDASDSMRGDRLATALAGARSFLEELQPLDQAKLMLFSDRILFETPFSSFPELLQAGLESVAAQGGTAINDHLFLAVQELSYRSGRRVVILLSDGVDTVSVLPMAEVEAGVRRSSALIYWLRIGGAPRTGAHSSSWRSAAEHDEELRRLEEAVAGSGGRILDLPHLAASTEAFAGILAELRRQYVLGYSPEVDRGDGRWHEVRVKVRRPGVEVRTAEGYFDF